ncbi:MAG: hypothetical protein LW825_06260 [Candidatus Jidaibacter sp.]|jgi:hypothetical protein|nr:hypothetical protein [Candidatus Jidaibacter sp.]
MGGSVALQNNKKGCFSINLGLSVLACSLVGYLAYTLSSSTSPNIIFSNSPNSFNDISLSGDSYLVSTGPAPFSSFLAIAAACATTALGAFCFFKLGNGASLDSSQDVGEGEPNEQQMSPSGSKGFMASICTAGFGYFAGSGSSYNIFPLAAGAISCGIVGAMLNGLFTGKYNFFYGNYVTPSIDCGTASHVVNIYFSCNSVESLIISVCKKVAVITLGCNYVNNIYSQPK